ncbi:MAG: AsmA family protein, partial [Acidobacteriaceae bacterium]
MRTEISPTKKKNKSYAKVWAISAVALVVLAIVVPPSVNINRFRHKILQSIGAGLHRPVYASAVGFTLFPRPAFVLHHLTVAEWPAYGAEPAITAETVTASLRASTLWHRRVEIASLHFDSPSVNLARDSNGKWNIESLIGNSPVLQLRTSAPAGRSPSEDPPPFPYVEATDARINFKHGAEKLPFSLEGADIAFWKQSGNEWHVRIKARPVRTDLTPGDAGQIVGEASVKTAGTFKNAPVEVNLEWRRGQLGEIGRLLNGKDSGWRGTVDWTASARGTLGQALVTADLHVEGFRRAEFIPPSRLDLGVHCEAEYVQADRRLDSFDCDAPLGGGHLVVKSTNRNSSIENAQGSIDTGHAQTGNPPSMQVALQHVSAGFFLDLLRHIHPGIASDASALGEVGGNVKCEWRGFDTLHSCSGNLHSTALTLDLPHVADPLHLSPLAITAEAAIPSDDALAPNAPSKKAKQGGQLGAPPVSPATWSLYPTRFSLGGTKPLAIAGTFTASGLALNLDGPVDLAKLNQLARAVNSPMVSGGIQSLRGAGEVALTLRSNWLPEANSDVMVAPASGDMKALANAAAPWFQPSQWSGTVQILNASLRLAPFPGRFHIAAAHVEITPTAVEWSGLKASYARVPFDGSVSWQTFCVSSRPPCARSFTLHTPKLNVDRLEAVLRGTHSGFLQQLNPWARGVQDLPEVSGTFNTDSLSAGKLLVKNASLQLQIEGHHAELMAISGRLFGGTLSGIEDGAPNGATSVGNSSAGNSKAQSSQVSGNAPGNVSNSNVGSAEWGNGTPTYRLRVMLANLKPNSVAAIWHE